MPAETSEGVLALFERAFGGDRTADAELGQHLVDDDTSIATYVWLPLRFVDGMPIINWHDEWRVEDLT